MTTPSSLTNLSHILTPENVGFVAEDAMHFRHLPEVIDPGIWDAVLSDLENYPDTGELWRVITSPRIVTTGMLSAIELEGATAVGIVSPTLGELMLNYQKGVEPLNLQRPNFLLNFVEYPPNMAVELPPHNDKRRGVVLITPSAGDGVLELFQHEHASTPFDTIQAGVGDAVLINGQTWHALKKPAGPERMIINLSVK